MTPLMKEIVEEMRDLNDHGILPKVIPLFKSLVYNLPDDPEALDYVLWTQVMQLPEWKELDVKKEFLEYLQYLAGNGLDLFDLGLALKDEQGKFYDVPFHEAFDAAMENRVFFDPVSKMDIHAQSCCYLILRATPRFRMLQEIEKENR
jgi:hypothetical protein